MAGATVWRRTRHYAGGFAVANCHGRFGDAAPAVLRSVSNDSAFAGPGGDMTICRPSRPPTRATEPLNGTWKLRVNDNATADTGYINSWSITF